MFKKISIVGNLGGDPEIKALSTGSTVASFSVACNEQWTDQQGDKQKKTTWFRVVAYQNGDRGLVSSLIQKYLRKGQLVFIEGDPTIRKYTDQQGNERQAFEIKLGPQSTIKMLGGEGKANGKDTDPPFEGAGTPPPAEKGDPGNLGDIEL